ncbi:MAG: hypothetical protein V7785_16245 [Bermanella sp.]
MTKLQMGCLLKLIKKHLLLTALFLSSTLHLTIIFWIPASPLNQSSLGTNQIILLEPSITPIPVITSDSQSQENKNAAKPSNKTKAQTRPMGKTIKIAEKIPTPKQEQAKKETKPIEQNTKTTSNAGVLLNQSGKEVTVEQEYESLIYQHLLKKSQSAPYFGKAIINLTLIRAGVATSISVELLEGSRNYQKWLHLKVLSANPFPAFPRALPGDTFTINVKMIHEQ